MANVELRSALSNPLRLLSDPPQGVLALLVVLIRSPDGVDERVDYPEDYGMVQKPGDSP
jgi:hypothetical protein